MVGLAFELHDTAAARRDLETASEDNRLRLLLRIKYQHVDPSFADILMYSFCYIGLLTGICRPTYQSPFSHFQQLLHLGRGAEYCDQPICYCVLLELVHVFGAVD